MEHHEAQIPKTFHIVIPGSVDNCAVVQQAKQFHPDWQIRVWKDVEDLPKHAFLKSASVAHDHLIGLAAVLSEGGVYIDSRMRILRRFDPLISSVGLFVASEDGHTLSDRVFGAVPKHPAVESLFRVLAQYETGSAAALNVFGEHGIFDTLIRWRTDICIYPREAFFPGCDDAQGHQPLAYCVPHAVKAVAKKPRPSTGFRIKARGSVRNALRPVVKAVRKVVGQPSIPEQRICYPVCEKIVVSTVHGHQLVADGTDYSLTPRLVRDGCIEFASERFLSKAIQGGDWFLDIGANIGVFSCIAAGKCGPFGRVFAFEPNPSMARLLMEGAALNFFHDRLLVRTIAVSNASEKKKLQIPKQRPGDARLSEQEITPTGGTFARTCEYLQGSEIIETDTIKLDDAFASDVPIEVIKIDVEGHEADVLDGAERLLTRRNFKYVMIEAMVHGQSGQWKRTIDWFHKMMSLGYEVCTPNGDGGLTRHDSLVLALEHMTEHNLVFSSSSRS